MFVIRNGSESMSGITECARPAVVESSAGLSFAACRALRRPVRRNWEKNGDKEEVEDVVHMSLNVTDNIREIRVHSDSNAAFTRSHIRNKGMVTGRCSCICAIV